MHFKRIEESKKEAEASIAKYGRCAEHNYCHFFLKQTPKRESYFFDLGNARGICAFLNKESKIMTIMGEILAPREEWKAIFHNFSDFCKKEFETPKIKIEIDEEFKKDLENEEKIKLSLNYHLDWPVYSLKNIDKELTGKQWKKLRNIRNAFSKDFRVIVKKPGNVNQAQMSNVLDKWLQKRSSNDYVDVNYYKNAIKSSFKGWFARIYEVNGNISAISAGWKVPNSSCIYFGIGLLDYKIKNFGDFVNVEDLLFAKELGFEFADLGGSDENLLNFKKKFHPDRIYRTFACTIKEK